MQIIPKKSLGQNFLSDTKILEKIADAAEIKQEDDIIEVGPGLGSLTKILCKRAKSVTAIELDSSLIAELRENTKEHGNLTIVNQNILDYQIVYKRYKVVANIPYYITSPIINHFLRWSRERPQLLVLLMQWEVAEKIIDSKKPSFLYWQVNLFGKPELVGKVKPGSFFPPPKVDSAILKISVYKTPLASEKTESILKLMEIGFKQPRKTIFNNLRCCLETDELASKLESANIPKNKRPHELTLQNWLDIASQTTMLN